MSTRISKLGVSACFAAAWGAPDPPDPRLKATQKSDAGKKDEALATRLNKELSQNTKLVQLLLGEYALLKPAVMPIDRKVMALQETDLVQHLQAMAEDASTASEAVTSARQMLKLSAYARGLLETDLRAATGAKLDCLYSTWSGEIAACALYNRYSWAHREYDMSAFKLHTKIVKERKEGAKIAAPDDFFFFTTADATTTYTRPTWSTEDTRAAAAALKKQYEALAPTRDLVADPLLATAVKLLEGEHLEDLYPLDLLLKEKDDVVTAFLDGDADSAPFVVESDAMEMGLKKKWSDLDATEKATYEDAYKTYSKKGHPLKALASNDSECTSGTPSSGTTGLPDNLFTCYTSDVCKVDVDVTKNICNDENVKSYKPACVNVDPKNYDSWVKTFLQDIPSNADHFTCYALPDCDPLNNKVVPCTIRTTPPGLPLPNDLLVRSVRIHAGLTWKGNRATGRSDILFQPKRLNTLAARVMMNNIHALYSLPRLFSASESQTFATITAQFGVLKQLAATAWAPNTDNTLIFTSYTAETDPPANTYGVALKTLATALDGFRRHTVEASRLLTLVQRKKVLDFLSTNDVAYGVAKSALDALVESSAGELSGKTTQDALLALKDRKHIIAVYQAARLVLGVKNAYDAWSELTGGQAGVDPATQKDDVAKAWQKYKDLDAAYVKAQTKAVADFEKAVSDLTATFTAARTTLPPLITAFLDALETALDAHLLQFAQFMPVNVLEV